jgi:lipopolysaccharide/colanic/teichoic acid biosynthesis glycosyltransferase
MKRAFDIACASIALVLLSPLLLVIAAAVRLDSEGPALFRQQRIGRGFRPFFIYKFRTMVRNAPKLGGLITVGDDPRITRAGRFLRRFKIDELPQLINVLKGDMSLVGPRPELREYVDAFRGDYEQILAIRPGLTDLASLKFIDEAGLLAQATDTERAYRECVLPEKLALAKQYVRDQSLRLDLLLLARTVRGILRLSAIM